MDLPADRLDVRAVPPRLHGAPAPDLLTPAALALLADVHRRFDARRRELLALRRARQVRCDAGALPDFRADTAAIRSADWRVAPIPEALWDRRRWFSTRRRRPRPRSTARHRRARPARW